MMKTHAGITVFKNDSLFQKYAPGITAKVAGVHSGVIYLIVNSEYRPQGGTSYGRLSEKQFRNSVWVKNES